MELERKILICGAGIAGSACAWWLHHYGYEVVIAEKARRLRSGGQNVDIKGAGQTVIEQMDLGARIKALGTHEQGQKFLSVEGRVIATLPRGAFGCLTSDYEILRGDLASVLYDATRENCDYRFGTAVAALDDTADGIDVTFSDGSTESFAAVICAEGIGSTTRGMMLGAETSFRHLGAQMAFFRIPARPEDNGWACTVNAADGTHLTLRPGHEDETTVLLTFPSNDTGSWIDDPARRMAVLRRALAKRGSVAERVSAELDAVDDIYSGPMSQVRVSTWSKGRFVLLGDAAYCPTPFTGAGCALALVGAYVLAGEIAQHANKADAFAEYEALVRPYAQTTQHRLNPAVVRLFHPRSRFGIAMTHGVERLLASRAIQALLQPSEAVRTRRIAEDFRLPTYHRRLQTGAA